MGSNRSNHASNQSDLQTQETTTVATVDAALRPDLWQLAYTKFSERDPKLVLKYERMLLKDTENLDNVDLQTKMSSILSRSGVSNGEANLSRSGTRSTILLKWSKLPKTLDLQLQDSTRYTRDCHGLVFASFFRFVAFPLWLYLR